MALQCPIRLAGTEEGCVSKVGLRPRVEPAPKGLKAYSQHRILPLFQAKYSQLLSVCLKDFFSLLNGCTTFINPFPIPADSKQKERHSFPVNSWQGVNHSKLSSFLPFPFNSMPLGEALTSKKLNRTIGVRGGGCCLRCKVNGWTEYGLETWAPLPTLQNQCDPEKSNCSLDRRFLNSNNNFWDCFGCLLIKRQICGVNVLFDSGFPYGAPA